MPASTSNAVTLIVLCFLVLRCAVITGIRANLYPKKAIVPVGAYLRSTCMLRSKRLDPMMVNNIVFRVNGTHVDSKWVTFLPTERKAILRILLHSAGNFKLDCLIKRESGKMRLLASQNGSAGYPPIQPAVTLAEVYNWEELRFEWEAPGQKSDTTTTALWTISASKTGYQKCPFQQGNRCIVNITHGFREDRSYSLKVHAHNLFGSSLSDRIAVNAKKTVRPAAVKETQVKEVNSHSVQLHLQSPRLGQELLYQVLYLSKWQKQEQVHAVSSDNDTVAVRLTGLVPATRYNITVRAHPRGAGYWSENVSLIVNTPEDVPSGTPLVSPGVIEIIQSGSTRRNIIAHWKRIPDFLANGQIQQYRIRYITNGVMKSEIVKDKLWAQLKNTFLLDEKYQLFIDGGTSVGFNQSLGPRGVLIGRQQSLPVPPRHVTVIAINDSSLLVRWSPVPEATGYTVFWCPGYRCSMKCQGESDWIEVDGHIQETVLHVRPAAGSGLGPQVAVSSHHNGLASGLLWASCTCWYHMQAHPQPPGIRKVQEKPDEIILQLAPQRCVYDRTAYIVTYNVYVYSGSENACSGIPVQLAFPAYKTRLVLPTSKFTKSAVHCIQIESVAYGDIKSGHRTQQFVKISHNGIQTGLLAGILVCVLVLLVPIAAGLLAYCRMLRRGPKHQFKGKISTIIPGQIRTHVGTEKCSDGGDQPTSAETAVETDKFLGKTKPENFNMLNKRHYYETLQRKPKVGNAVVPDGETSQIFGQSNEHCEESDQSSGQTSELNASDEEEDDTYTGARKVVAEDLAGADSSVSVGPSCSTDANFIPWVHSKDLENVLQTPAAPIQVSLDDMNEVTCGANTEKSGPNGSVVGVSVNVAPETGQEVSEMLSCPLQYYNKSSSTERTRTCETESGYKQNQQPDDTWTEQGREQSKQSLCKSRKKPKLHGRNDCNQPTDYAVYQNGANTVGVNSSDQLSTFSDNLNEKLIALSELGPPITGDNSQKVLSQSLRHKCDLKQDNIIASKGTREDISNKTAKPHEPDMKRYSRQQCDRLKTREKGGVFILQTLKPPGKAMEDVCTATVTVTDTPTSRGVIPVNNISPSNTTINWDKTTSNMVYDDSYVVARMEELT